MQRNYTFAPDAGNLPSHRNYPEAAESGMFNPRDILLKFLQPSEVKTLHVIGQGVNPDTHVAYMVFQNGDPRQFFVVTDAGEFYTQEDGSEQLALIIQP